MRPGGLASFEILNAKRQDDKLPPSRETGHLERRL
jgi:hypothetical protein